MTWCLFFDTPGHISHTTRLVGGQNDFKGPEQHKTLSAKIYTNIGTVLSSVPLITVPNKFACWIDISFKLSTTPSSSPVQIPLMQM